MTMKRTGAFSQPVSPPMTDKELDEVWEDARLYPDGLNFGGHTVMRLLATIDALRAIERFEHLERYRWEDLPVSAHSIPDADKLDYQYGKDLDVWSLALWLGAALRALKVLAAQGDRDAMHWIERVPSEVKAQWPGVFPETDDTGQIARTGPDGM